MTIDMESYMKLDKATQFGENKFHTYTNVDNTITMAAISGQFHTAFVGMATNEAFFKEDSSAAKEELLVIAVNNRTRERNYFRLYSQLLDGEITEGDFNREIEENEDRYAVSTNMHLTREKLQLAAELSKGIMDVSDIDDFLTLYSIDGCHAERMLEGGDK